MRFREDEIVFERRLLEAAQHTIGATITHERVHATFQPEAVIENTVRGLLVRLQQYMATDRLVSDEHEVEAWVDIPWEATVMVEIPNGWVRRLLRRPTRKFWKDVGGHIKQRATITIHLAHLAQFPDAQISWPRVMGRPVRVTEVSTRTDPRWSQEVDLGHADQPIVY